MRRTPKNPTAAADEKLAALVERQAEADSATDRVAEAVENAMNGADPEKATGDPVAAADPPKARAKRASKKAAAEPKAAAAKSEPEPAATKPAPVEQRFYLNGKLLSRKTLSAVAYHQGYVLVPAGQRIPLPEFEQWLKEQGVADPYGEWDVTFGPGASKSAQGKVLSARLAVGGELPPPSPAAEKVLEPASAS